MWRSSASGATAAVLVGREFAVTGFSSASAKSLQSRPALGLCVTCLSAVATLSPIIVFSFTDDSLLASLPSLPCLCSSAAHRSAFKIAFSALLCSRDLGDFLSRLHPARDPCTFPDETSLDSPVLHPQHIHITMIDSRVRVLHPLGSCVGMSSLRRPRQHVPQESNKPCFPFPHELPPSCELLIHTCVVTLVQCLCHHGMQYICVLSVMLSLGVDDSSVVVGSSSFRWSTAPRYDLSLNNRSARFIGSPSNLPGLPITLVSTTPGCLYVVVDVAF